MDSVFASKEGDVELAKELARKAFALEPRDVRPHLQLGILLIGQGYYAEALPHCRTVAKAMPSASYSTMVGFCLSSIGRKSEAIKAYREAIALDPDFDEAHLNLGGILYALNPEENGESALFHFRRVIEINPDCAWGHIGVSRGLVQLGDFDGALQHADQALSLDPSQPAFLEQVGSVKTSLASRLDPTALDADRKRAFADAIDANQRAIEADPSRPFPHAHMGMCLRYGGLEPQAEEYFRAANALGEDGVFGAVLGDHLADNGEFEEAELVLAQTCERYPDCVVAWRDLGRALIRDNHPEGDSNLERAILCFERALSLDPKAPESLYRLGNALARFEGGRLERAQRLLQECVALKPDHTRARSNLEEIARSFENEV